MENWGLVTYREVEVLIAEGASADQKQRVCTVITQYVKKKKKVIS